MNVSRAFLAGALGGIAMSILMFLGRSLIGMDVNLEMMMGTMAFEPGPVAWMVGLVMHVMMSGLIGIAYLWAFETFTKRAGIAMGLAISVPHILIAGIVMGAVIPAMHRLIPEQTSGPGYFLANHGTMGIIAFVMLHLVFGAIVGAMCVGHLRRPRLTASVNA